MWIELPPPKMAKLNKVSRDQRRDPREQAAYFVERALARVKDERDTDLTRKVSTPN
jgi:hypothetical protein